MGWYTCPRYLVPVEGVYFLSEFATEAEFLASPRVRLDFKRAWPNQRAAGLFAVWLHQQLDEGGLMVLGKTPKEQRPARDWLISRGIPSKRARDVVYGSRWPAAASLPGLAAVLEVPVADVYKAAGRELVLA